ncbi:MAG: FadR family transcriptional regulator [Clostridia bacterium]|nr:FadR family transcriptional regulator [Clostridia bacterium]
MNTNNTPNRNAMYEVIADKIEEMILSDEMQASEKLPSESVLSEKFGVSRPVVREALNTLRERGLIASRQGAASVITEPDADTLLRNFNRIILMKKVSPMQVYQVRMVLETLCAGLAAKKCTQSEIENLRTLNEKVRTSKGNYELRARTDLEFHIAIAECSGNPLLSVMLEALASLLEPIIINNLKNLEKDTGDLFHGRIIDAIESGDEASSEKLMREHLTESAMLYGADFY